MNGQYRNFESVFGKAPDNSKLLRNRVQCTECGTVLESTFVHDYHTCECRNNTMVDGGLEYARYGGVDMRKVKELHEYVPEDTFLWGVLDLKSGIQTPTPLKELEDSHIQNIALLLRNRYKDYTYTYSIRRHKTDLIMLKEHILPELKKRGLEEVTEEIPYL